jgi:hypothetical protein
MTEAGLGSFDALAAHVHWVYCAYILLDELKLKGAASLEDKQRRITAELSAAPFRDAVAKILKTRTQYGGADNAQAIARAVLQGAYAA